MNPSQISNFRVSFSSKIRIAGDILLCLGVPTLFWFARFKGKQSPDKTLSPLFVVVNRSYISTFHNTTGQCKWTNVLSKMIIANHYSESYSRIASIELNSCIEQATITTGIYYLCTCT